MENVSLNFSMVDISGIKRKVFEAFKIPFLFGSERRPLMVLEKFIPFLSPFPDALILGNRFQTISFLRQQMSSLD
jgi:hypothetical protein